MYAASPPSNLNTKKDGNGCCRPSEAQHAERHCDRNLLLGANVNGCQSQRVRPHAGKTARTKEVL